jgi:thiamine biosynthesis lipoprotein|tara:strand:+ start:182 stop:1228 length:1047 start_codon:yes stop_codon:yes gene_type:complete
VPASIRITLPGVVRLGFGLSFLLAILLSSACDQPDSYLFTGPTMGTVYNVKVVPVPAQSQREQLAVGIQGTVDRINLLMSTYRDDSELSRFNRSSPGSWFELSAETAEVISLGLTISELTAGSFDMTVGPLVNLWGFGPQTGRDSIPSEADIRAALQLVGYRNIVMRATLPSAVRKSENVYVDLSAIAKGYAVDKVAQFLEAKGVVNYLVEIGGELKARGRKQNGALWQVAIESPGVAGRESHRVLPLANISVATSGDYWNYFEVEGVRYSHTIDPTTGRPVTHNVASVTVLDSSTARADALATAFNVMGTKAGLALANEHNLAVLFIEKGENGFRERSSAAFAPHLQ